MGYANHWIDRVQNLLHLRMKHLALILFAALLTSCSDRINTSGSVYEIEKDRDGSTCYFKLGSIYYVCPCPDSVRVGDRVVIQFVKP